MNIKEDEYTIIKNISGRKGFEPLTINCISLAN